MELLHFWRQKTMPEPLQPRLSGRGRSQIPVGGSALYSSSGSPCPSSTYRRARLNPSGDAILRVLPPCVQTMLSRATSPDARKDRVAYAFQSFNTRHGSASASTTPCTWLVRMWRAYKNQARNRHTLTTACRTDILDCGLDSRNGGCRMRRRQSCSRPACGNTKWRCPRRTWSKLPRSSPGRCEP